MRLTRKKAIELCIELWEWLAKTGKQKGDWPEWRKYGQINCDCWFCEYDTQKSPNIKCVKCIFPFKNYGLMCEDIKSYQKWEDAKTPRTRKKYAKLFLEQIKTLRR